MDPKTRGIVAYLTLIGWVIALVTNNPKDEYASFHIRQMLGLVILSIAGSIAGVIPFIGLIIIPVVMIAVIVFWVMGLISAIQGSQKPLPLVGDYFQDWFKGL